jgi:hypothetical protein
VDNDDSKGEDFIDNDHQGDIDLEADDVGSGDEEVARQEPSFKTPQKCTTTKMPPNSKKKAPVLVVEEVTKAK